MLRTFRLSIPTSTHHEVIEVDMERGMLRQFFYIVHEGHLAIFGEYRSTTSEMGLETPLDFVKNRTENYTELKDGFDLYHLPTYMPNSAKKLKTS